MAAGNKVKSIIKVLEASRRKLLDTGTRNRLIHVNRSNQRANCLNVINEHADEIYSILRVRAKRMRFKAMGKDNISDGEDMLLATPELNLQDDSERLTDNFIETPLGPEALARRLLRLAGSAKTAEEEQGVNILYLAVGFLRWRETPSSEVQREAPLILLPVQLIRNERTSTYDVTCRDDDISTNLPLGERLLQDFGVSLPEVDEIEGWKPSNYYELVSDAISGQPGWTLDMDGMQLGFFSFAKLLMHRDLDIGNWPEGVFTENPLIKGLLLDGFPDDEPLFGPEDKLDEKLDPAEIIQVIDADASQTKVIEEVRRGSSLVVQGPPGTGKSQTITNIIAAAAHDGKSVLFVAEKMAALSVVHNRLVKSGLRNICLELHSRSANKKALAQELGRTLMASSKALPCVADPTQLRKTRDELNRITTLLHTPLPEVGDSPFDAISQLIGFLGKGTPPPGISLKGLEFLGRKRRKPVLIAIDTFISTLKRVGSPHSHSFRGTYELDLQPTDLSRLDGELKSALNIIAGVIDRVSEIAKSTHQPEPRTLSEIMMFTAGLDLFAQAPDGVAPLVSVLFGNEKDAQLQKALEIGKKLTQSKEDVAKRFAQTFWDTDVSNLRSEIDRGKKSWVSRWFGGYRRASKSLSTLLSIPLPKSPEARLELIDEILNLQQLRRCFSDYDPLLQAKLQSEWKGENTPFEKVLTALNWITTVQKGFTFSSAVQIQHALSTLAGNSTIANTFYEMGDAYLAAVQAPLERLKMNLVEGGFSQSVEDTPLEEFYAAFNQMNADLDQYTVWSDYLRAKDRVVGGGASAIVDAIASGTLEPESAKEEFSYACAEAIWNAARKSRPGLNKLFRLDRHELVRIFCELEQNKIDTAKTLVLSRHFEQMPRGTMGEMGIIRGEIGRKRGHKPIRWVMKNAGGMVQRIKPVMLMSPLSVAQFLPPGSVTFDLLVIDEASQIRPEDALGVIARAKQIVVVGDQKQLPPTSFFERLVDDIEEHDDVEDDLPLGATAADMESILSLCEARGLRQRMLEWHYRSRDPSLICVSNAEFYNDGLVLPPSPLQLDTDYGLKFTRVPGVYARGGSGLGRQGTNRIDDPATK